MKENRPLISFDWAIKRMLRQRPNYGILEGFLSELLKRDITIINIPESETNAENANDKINKVDILCESLDKEVILIELQYNSENDYFHRMLFGSSKIITDYMGEGYKYDQVKKIYSINIVYFNLGQGDDYVYHGITEFRGIHNNDILKVNTKQKTIFSIDHVKDIYPEYYLLRVNKFDDIAKDPLDEWIYYFKNSKLPEGFKAKGLELVSQKLKIDEMDTKTRADYEAHQKEMAISYGVLETAKYDGIEIGKEIGKEIGVEIGERNTNIKVAKSLKKAGVSIDIISNSTGLSKDEIEKL